MPRVPSHNATGSEPHATGSEPQFHGFRATILKVTPYYLYSLILSLILRKENLQKKVRRACSILKY
jgi:hypothetical protein